MPGFWDCNCCSSPMWVTHRKLPSTHPPDSTWRKDLFNQDSTIATDGFVAGQVVDPNDGSVYVIGATRQGGSPAGYPMLAKYSATGDLLWSKNYQGQGTQVALSEDASVVVWSASRMGIPGERFGLWATDPNGNELWNDLTTLAAVNRLVRIGTSVYGSSGVTDVSKWNINTGTKAYTKINSGAVGQLFKCGSRLYSTVSSFGTTSFYKYDETTGTQGSVIGSYPSGANDDVRRGWVDLDGASVLLTRTILISPSTYSVRLMKWSVDQIAANLTWSVVAASAGWRTFQQYSPSLAVDSAGSIYMGLEITVGGAPFNTVNPALPSLKKFNSSGVAQWSSLVHKHNVHCVSVRQSTGDIYIAGHRVRDGV